MSRVERLFAKRLCDAGYETTLAIGVTSVDQGDTEIDALLRRADRDMYSEKTRIKNSAYLN
jgi:PleD family two-component response regulator